MFRALRALRIFKLVKVINNVRMPQVSEYQVPSIKEHTLTLSCLLTNLLRFFEELESK